MSAGDGKLNRRALRRALVQVDPLGASQGVSSRRSDYEKEVDGVSLRMTLGDPLSAGIVAVFRDMYGIKLDGQVVARIVKEYEAATKRQEKRLRSVRGTAMAAVTAVLTYSLTRLDAGMDSLVRIMIVIAAVGLFEVAFDLARGKPPGPWKPKDVWAEMKGWWRGDD